MPPEHSITGSSVGSGGPVDLSDENVAVLYEIVQNAEARPEARAYPFRALFAAYDDVLPKHQLDAANDQIYLQFLFQLGDGRASDGNLFQNFERLLAEQGIQLEFDNPENDVALEAELSEVPPESILEPGKPVRSSSFTSTLVFQNKEAKAAPPRPHSIAAFAPTTTFSRFEGPSYRRQESRDLIYDGDNDLDITHYPVPRETLRRQLPPGKRPKDELHRDGPLRHSRPSAHDTPPQKVIRKAEEQLDLRYSPNERAPQSQRNSRVLEGEAVAYRALWVQSRTRNHLANWLWKAMTCRARREQSEITARYHDERVLQKQAFDNWRACLQQHRESIEREVYFENLEQEAVQSWDTHILERAFTHWIQSTRDEVAQRVLARQHVLALKYFHAWHDITLKSQASIDRCVTRRFLTIWKDRYMKQLSDEAHAETLWEKNARRNAYWLWFWAFCDRQAPVWHEKRLLQSQFKHWIGRSRKFRQLSKVADVVCVNTKRQSSLSKWSKRTAMQDEHSIKADDLRLQSMASKTLRQWSRCTQYAPRVQKLSDSRDWRIASETFANVIQRHRASQYAERVCQARLKRHMWTQWNAQLRYRYLARSVDDRCTTEALYRWLLRARLILLQRLQRARRLKGAFELWRRVKLEREDRRNESLDAFKRGRGTHQIETAISHWRSITYDCTTLAKIALEFYRPKVANEALHTWLSAMNFQHTMNVWAGHARIFFTTKSTLKLWSKAYIESRKQKRQLAYNLFTKSHKTRVISRVLDRWRDATASVSSQAREAIDYYRQNLLRFGEGLLKTWEVSSMLYKAQAADAALFFEVRCMQNTFKLMLSHSREVWQLAEAAEEFENLKSQKTAFSLLRRIRLQSIEYKGSQSKADDLKAVHVRRHARHILFKWRDVTAMERDGLLDESNLALSRRGFGSSIVDKTLVDARHSTSTPWRPASHGRPLMRGMNSALKPLPGYLSTPSKRAERARALVHSSTPTGTPFAKKIWANVDVSAGAQQPVLQASQGHSAAHEALESSPLIQAFSVDDDR